MGQRFYPRNSQARSDVLARDGAQSGPLTFPRNDQARRDALAVGMGNAQCTVAGTLACDESEIVTGGQELVLTVTGNDRFVNDVARDSALNAAIIAAQDVMDGIKAELTDADFALSADGKVLTITLPAVAAYALDDDAAYAFVLPVEAFKNRSGAVTVADAITVTNEA